MHKQLIERSVEAVAEEMESFDNSGPGPGIHFFEPAELTEFVTRCLARIDAERGKGAQAPTLDVDVLSNIIRTADGNHSLGAGALAEKIIETIGSRPPASCPKCANLRETNRELSSKYDALQAKVTEQSAEIEQASQKYVSLQLAQAGNAEALRAAIAQRSDALRSLREQYSDSVMDRARLAEEVAQQAELIEMCEKSLIYHVEMTRPLNSTDEVLAALAAHRVKSPNTNGFSEESSTAVTIAKDAP